MKSKSLKKLKLKKAVIVQLDKNITEYIKGGSENGQNPQFTCAEACPNTVVNTSCNPYCA